MLEASLGFLYVSVIASYIFTIHDSSDIGLNDLNQQLMKKSWSCSLVYHVSKRLECNMLVKLTLHWLPIIHLFLVSVALGLIQYICFCSSFLLLAAMKSSELCPVQGHYVQNSGLHRCDSRVSLRLVIKVRKRSPSVASFIIAQDCPPPHLCFIAFLIFLTYSYLLIFSTGTETCSRRNSSLFQRVI